MSTENNTDSTRSNERSTPSEVEKKRIGRCGKNCCPEKRKQCERLWKKGKADYGKCGKKCDLEKRKPCEQLWQRHRYVKKIRKFLVSWALPIGMILILCSVVANSNITTAPFKNQKLVILTGEKEESNCTPITAKVVRQEDVDNNGNQYLDIFLRILSPLCSALGIAFFGLGFLSVFQESKWWGRYFENRIKNLVIKHDYIQWLPNHILEKIQRQFYARFAGREDIGERGGFLDYFNSSLMRYMAEPSRERVRRVEELIDATNNMGLMKTTWEYRCRKGKNGIQNSVNYLFNQNNFTDSTLLALRMTLTLPCKARYESFHGDGCVNNRQEKCIRVEGNYHEHYCWVNNAGIESACKKYPHWKDNIDKFKQLTVEMRVSAGHPSKLSGDSTRKHSSPERWCPDENKWSAAETDGKNIYSFTHKLEGKERCDGLKFSIEAYTIVNLTRLRYWYMSFPARDITHTLRWPKNFKGEISALLFDPEPFGSESHRVRYGDDGQSAVLEYHSWLLPGQGVTWEIYPDDGQDRGGEEQGEG
ncbi:MAG: hypothetical protein FWE95_00155 [Planctomycetaceae bacterium]|nr:hypothetical protein [Planctomycetaceae bacterium]